MTVATDAPVRCSAWARDAELSPAGTAGYWSGFLLVETPLPWPHDVGEIPALGTVTPLLKPHRIRMQAVLAPEGGGHGRVVLHRAPPSPEGWFRGYRRHSATGTSGEGVEGVVSRLLAESPSPAGGVTDVLVCTHGRRDVCCGSLGTTLALALASDRSAIPDGATLWRTSHTGGHRFAPTFILLPQGTAWAFADETLVRQVLERSVPFADLAAHYRGCAGLGAPQVQLLEREVLRQEGWELLDRPRRGFLADGSEGQVAVLEADDGNGGVDRWEARVTPGRVLRVPDCGRPLAEARKSETEWAISDLRRL